MTTPNPEKAARILLAKSTLRPKLAIVLGSGFDGIAQAVTEAASIPYRQLPGFPVGQVRGHSARAVIGLMGSSPVLLLCGRCHYYEGFGMEEVTFPIRVLAAAGIRDVILTNAAGGISRRLRPGSLMCLTDHINLMGCSPLRGKPIAGREQFVDLSQVYSPDLIRLLQKAALKTGARLQKGVYLAVSGPNYETPAEIRAFARLGADAVGMSTVPEAIVARQCGLRVAGLSCVTNQAAGLSERPLSHAEVLAAGQAAQEKVQRLLSAFAGMHGDLGTD